MYVALPVIFLLIKMNVTINFYDQTGSVTVETGDIAINDPLSAEMKTFQPTERKHC